jgi:hypothetical protein
MKPINPVDITKISPERQRVARIFKTHIEKAIEELGTGYNVTLQDFYLGLVEIDKMGMSLSKNLKNAVN